jgi:multisubunit Na+/H+ antiporter MnhB subunit
MADQSEQLWRNAEWKIEAKPDGTFSPDDMRNALLIDIRGLLRQIKTMMVFFTALIVIGLVLGLLIRLSGS